MSIRVLMVDRTGSARQAFLGGLSELGDIELVGCAESLMQAAERIDGCDVVLICADLPDDGAYRLARLISRGGHCARSVLIGINEIRPSLLRYLEVGVYGIVCSTAPVVELAHAIRSVSRGEAIVPPESAAVLVARLAELSAWFEDVRLSASEAENLTRREREILHLIGRDFTNQDIANHLIIEVGTVKNHVHNILAKLKVSSRREAANYLLLVNDHRRIGRRQRIIGQAEQPYWS